MPALTNNPKAYCRGPSHPHLSVINANAGEQRDIRNSGRKLQCVTCGEQEQVGAFAHDADVGVRGWGATPAEAFEQAALALTAVVTHVRGRTTDCGRSQL